MATTKGDSIIGCLLGTAVADAIGLPCEGLSKRRLHRLYPEIDGHHFFFGRGMVSDDTEHTCMVAQALLVSGGEVEVFRKSLAWRLRFWFLGLPASIGLATARAIVKLWLGFPSDRSGVFSAGNGPAMRSAILGVAFGHDTEKLRALVRAATRITHTDPKAEFGALAVALAAHMASVQGGDARVPVDYEPALRAMLEGEGAEEFLELIGRTAESVARQEPTESFAEALGLGKGVDGYVYHTVPVALHAAWRHPRDFRSAVSAAVRCGGDTDTTAAIVGGIVGAAVGKRGIAEQWLDGLCEWPRTVKWIEELGKRLAGGVAGATRTPALPLSVVGLALRNVFFLLVVLCHGIRRLLPPY